MSLKMTGLRDNRIKVEDQLAIRGSRSEIPTARLPEFIMCDKEHSRAERTPNPHSAFRNPHLGKSAIRIPHLGDSALRNGFCLCILIACLSCGGRAQSLPDAINAWRTGDYPLAEKSLAQLAQRGDTTARVAYARVLLEVGKYSEGEAAGPAAADELPLSL